MALYSDRQSIFRVNHSYCVVLLTQFSRELKTLDIAPIHANKPQAKGRVERANQPLQDRLVKVLRLRLINDIGAGNRFLPEFISDYNTRFAKPSQSPSDAHRPVQHSRDELGLTFSLHHTRKLSKILSCQFFKYECQNTVYGNGYLLRVANVTVCESFDKRVTLLHTGYEPAYRVLQEGARPIAVESDKSVHSQIDQIKRQQAERPA